MRNNMMCPPPHDEVGRAVSEAVFILVSGYIMLDATAPFASGNEQLQTVRSEFAERAAQAQVQIDHLQHAMSAERLEAARAHGFERALRETLPYTTMLATAAVQTITPEVRESWRAYDMTAPPLRSVVPRCYRCQMPMDRQRELIVTVGDVQVHEHCAGLMQWGKDQA